MHARLALLPICLTVKCSDWSEKCGVIMLTLGLSVRPCIWLVLARRQTSAASCRSCSPIEASTVCNKH